MLVEFSKAGWIEKARRQPDKVWSALEVGDHLNVLAFDPETFDAVYLSKGKLVKPKDPENINELTHAEERRDDSMVTYYPGVDPPSDKECKGKEEEKGERLSD